jgi:hypothetical protein
MHCAIVGDGCAGPPYPSIRIDQAFSLGAISLADGLPGGLSRPLSVDLGPANATAVNRLAGFGVGLKFVSAESLPRAGVFAVLAGDSQEILGRVTILRPKTNRKCAKTPVKREIFTQKAPAIFS